VKRRVFIALIGSAAAAWPLTAKAQQKGALRTVGVLMGIAETDPDSQQRIAAFRDGFAALGWKNGENIHVVYRWAAGKIELIEQYGRELVALKAAVILGNGTPVVAALQKMTTTIPIICAPVNDPVGLGFVQSLSRPGGNITGFTFIDPPLIGKWMELLKGSSPGLRRAGLLFNPATTPFYPKFLTEIAAAPATPLALVALPVGTADAIDKTVADFALQDGSGLMVGPDPFNIVNIERLAQAAANNRMPGISVYRPFAEAGGLMTYGPDTAEIFRQAADYVDRILKGANPAELPVQQPTKFEFIINLKAAKSLGIPIPPNLLALADEVIE
jgi:putative tryptophan/tyrosine transport system substrate-binding protein